jgi:hypothetical protein
MAVFEIADEIRKANEGGWVHNPSDVGGETAFGWSRKFWPKLRIWPIIDGYKKRFTSTPAYGTGAYNNWTVAFNRALRRDPALMRNVDQAYKEFFWDANLLSLIGNQDVANWLYDHAVNAGGRGIRWMQLAARVMPDGKIGPITIAAINAADPEKLLERAADIAGAYRLDRAHDDPGQISFLMSWLKRDGQLGSILEHVRQLSRDGVLDAEEVAQLKQELEATS